MLKSTKSVLMAILVRILGSIFSASVLLFLRNALHNVPTSVRPTIMKVASMVPLWLSRFLLNFGTTPIGDERTWIHKIEHNTWKGSWIIPNQNSLKQAEDVTLHSDLVVLYTHGGGFCMGHAAMYMETFQLIINHLQNEHNIRASILSLEYSLSPEHVWPKARDETIEAYQYLTDTIGIPSSKIIIAGDSSGGNVAAVSVLTIKSREHLSQPAGVALISPWIDLTINQPCFAAYRDDILRPAQIAKYVPYYIPNYKNLDEASRTSMIRNPLISPFYGNFNGTCPIFISYGERELFKSNIDDFKANLENQQCNLTTLRGDNQCHNWIVASLMSSSKMVYDRDCKILADWMASIVSK